MLLKMVGIIVSDMDASILFYETLGFKADRSYGNDYVELSHNHVTLSLNTKKMVTDVYGFEPQLIGQRIELAFELTSNKHLDQMSDLLLSKGYKLLKTPWLAFWGQYYAIVLDPDENLISLFVNQ